MSTSHSNQGKSGMVEPNQSNRSSDSQRTSGQEKKSNQNMPSKGNSSKPQSNPGNNPRKDH